jgi:hypothetical protein
LNHYAEVTGKQVKDWVKERLQEILQGVKDWREPWDPAAIQILKTI